jgi:hypothetical protein
VELHTLPRVVIIWKEFVESIKSSIKSKALVGNDVWGGSDNCGGSPRERGNSLSPEALTEQIEHFQHDLVRTTTRVGEEMCRSSGVSAERHTQMQW